MNPESPETSGYHLFLEPAGELRRELSAVIASLAGQYGGPVFPPHVTLLASIPDAPEAELTHKARELADSLAPLSLTLGELASEDAYFRALYSVILEQEALRALHAEAARAFGMPPEDAYLAHLSLLYGNYPEGEKAVSRAGLSYPRGVSFTASTLHLYKTPGPPGAWVQIAEFPFSAASGRAVITSFK